MPLRRITVLEPIELKTLGGDPITDQFGRPLEAIEFRTVVIRLLNHRNFGATRDAARSARAIEEAVWDAKPGQQVDLAEEDWKLLKDAASEPSCTEWAPMLLRRVVPVLDAIVEAKEPPREPSTDVLEQ